MKKQDKQMIQQCMVEIQECLEELKHWKTIAKTLKGLGQYVESAVGDLKSYIYQCRDDMHNQRVYLLSALAENKFDKQRQNALFDVIEQIQKDIQGIRIQCDKG